MTAQPIPTPIKSEAEIRAEHKAELQALVGNITQQTEIRLMGEMRKLFADDTPDRSKLPDQRKGDEVEIGDGPLKLRHAADYLYDRMPAEVRKYRNPKIDFDMKRWIRAAAPMWRDPVVSASIIREYGGVDEFGNQYRGERAVIAEGTPTSGVYAGTGGSLIPLPVAAGVHAALNRAAKLRHFVTTYTSPTAVLRTSSVTTGTAAMVSESAIATEASPAFTAVLLTKKKMQYRAFVTIEELEDAAINLVSLLTERAGGQLGQLEDDQIATATGTPPDFTSSFDLAAITSIAEATTTVLVIADIFTLWFALPQPYRRNAIWFGNSQIMQFLSTLNAGGRQWMNFANNPIGPVGDPAAAASIGTIFGRPVLEVGTDAGGLYVGDPSYYALLTSPGVSLRVMDQTQAATDAIEYRFTTRADGNIALVDAFRSMDALATVA